LWPKGRPTHNWQFFAWMFGVPSLIWGCLFAARVHSYEIGILRAQDHNAERAETVEHNTAYAERPLVLLGSAYVTAMGDEKLSTRIAAGESALQTREVRNTKEVRAHSELPRKNFASMADLLQTVATGLLAKLKPALSSVPRHAPLEVWLDIQDDTAAKESRAVLQQLVERQIDRSIETPQLIKPHDGIMALDAWLDDDSGASAKYVLVIAMQLRSEVPADTGEAGAALLFGWPDRVYREQQSAYAHVHRPVVASSDLERTVLATALDWGATQPEEVERTWISGLTELRRDTNLVLTPYGKNGAAPKVASIDVALGHTGSACGWLATAIAAEHCRSSGAIQLISTEARRQPCWLVVRPSPSTLT